MDNVIPFSKELRRFKADADARCYSVDVISDSPVNGMVLIEACIPVPALTKFRAILAAKEY